MKIIKVTSKDCTSLQQICRKTYSQNFQSHWISDGLEVFLEKEFNLNRLYSDLENDNINYYFIQHDSKIIGFAKITINASFFNFQKVAELDKIYILPTYKGLGLGKIVINELIKLVKEQGMQYLYLCVLETNSSAIKFYQKTGFQYHSKTIINAPKIKEEHKKMNRMLKFLV